MSAARAPATDNPSTPGMMATPFADAVHISTAMSDLQEDLNNLIRTSHESSDQLVAVVREEFSTALSTVSTALESLKESVCPPESKRQRTSSDLCSDLVDTHDCIKVEVGSQMVDVPKGTDIFPDIGDGAQYSIVFTTGLDKVMQMTALNDIRTLLSRRVQSGQSSIFSATYLKRASVRLHDSILRKICSAFISGLQDENRLSPCFR